MTLFIVAAISPKIFILKAFPPALALASNQPFFSIEMFESWVSPSGYELYETWLKNSANIAQDSAHGQELVDDASTKDIKRFRETVRFIWYTLPRINYNLKTFSS